MDNKIYLNLAIADLEAGADLFSLAKKTNEIALANGETSKPFAGSELAIFGMVDYLKHQDDLTRATVISYTSIEECWMLLHIEVGIFKRQLNEAQIKTVHSLAWALHVIGKEELVLNGLDKKIIKKYWKVLGEST